MRDELRSRQSIPVGELYRQFYADSTIDNVLIEELLHHVATELSVDVTKLRPTDRFSVELAPARGNAWDSGFGILAYELQRLAKEKGKPLLARIETVDDYIRAMAEVY